MTSYKDDAVLFIVATGDADQCALPQPITLPSTSGYISNIISHDTACGTARTPWEIRAKPGQHIRIRLIDFSLSASNRQSAGESSRKSVYGTVKERSQSTTIYAGRARDTQVYTSRSHTVQIVIFTLSPLQGYFLLYYEGMIGTNGHSKRWYRYM